ncbi:hypothetical protein ISCGN_007170 [Ixodes scapularis]
MSSINRVLRLLGYKLDRKLRGFRARFREDCSPANTGANPWGPTTVVLESLRRRKFGRLVCKPGNVAVGARNAIYKALGFFFWTTIFWKRKMMANGRDGLVCHCYAVWFESTGENFTRASEVRDAPAAMKILPALAFLPVGAIPEVFQDLLVVFPLEAIELADYFEDCTSVDHV